MQIGRPSRRALVQAILAAGASFAALALPGGCVRHPGALGRVENVWGRRGIADGRLQKPRAMAIDAEDRLYIVDMTARIQVFSPNGELLRGWRTPEWEFGKPVGLTIDRQGRLLVADTHYHRVLFYSPEGTLLEDLTLGGVAGHGPGEFGLVTDVAQDSQGNYYVGEFGNHDRIQKFSPQGRYLFEWGGNGNRPGQFLRPQSLVCDENDLLWVADACNHRIQVFDAAGESARLVQIWGEQGAELGKLRYPYGLAFDDRGHVYVAEWGNHRVQKFTRDGKSLGAFGGPGRGRGQLHSPWALVRDRRGRIHVLDTGNHRVQTVRM